MNTEIEDDEDTVDLGEAIRQALTSEVRPDWGRFWFTVTMNFIVGPLLTWGALCSAGILPMSFSGFLSVVAVVGLTRLCILDNGIAELHLTGVNNG